MARNAKLVENMINIGSEKFKDDRIDFHATLCNMMELDAIRSGKILFLLNDSMYTSRGYEIIGTDICYKWAKAYGFEEVTNLEFYKIENGIPIAKLNLDVDKFTIIGDIDMVVDAAHVFRDCFKAKVFDENELEGIELVGFNENSPVFKKTTLGRIHTLKEEYYPYIRGGFEALINDFIMSDESVLILGGVPGTGKSVGMRETMINLGLQPIMAQDAQAISHPLFINTIFSAYDSMYKNNTEDKNDKVVYESSWFKPIKDLVDELMPLNKSKRGKITIGDDVQRYARGVYAIAFAGPNGNSAQSQKEDSEISVTQGEAPTLPIIFIEDAGAILKKMNDDNVMMQNLRNRTDGVVKKYPVKIVFTTNEETSDEMDDALIRDGRCYGFFSFPKLTPEQAIAARKAAGMPDFEEVPTKSVCLATALREPRKKIFINEETKRYMVK